MAETFVGRLMHRAKSMHDKLESIKEKTAETMGKAMMLAEVSAANAGFSYINGRFGNTQGATGVDSHYSLVGVPVDLATAALLGGMGLIDAAGPKYSEHMFNLGVGSLQSFLSRNMISMGLAASVPSGTTAGAFAGALPAPGHAWGWNPHQHAAYARG